ncbi:hypothetical protein MKEN_01478100 [Mycena kentingensis (nom. inval.)]|nr:hypothetical protein MKEN_01478100 [Mycena kentingensis (nom. inval.)]
MTKPRKRSGSPPAPLPAKRLRRQCRGPFWNRHKLCAHCGKSLRKATRDKHYAEYPDQDRDDSETDDACDCLCETASEGDDNSDAASPAATTHNFFAGDEALLDALRDDLAGARTRKSRQPREDTPRATQFSEDAPYEANSTLDYASEDDEFIVDADAEYNEVEDEEIEQPGLAEMEAELEDMLLADAEQQLFEKRASHLTEKDRTNIRMFILKLVANMPRNVVGKKTNFNLSLARPNDGVLEEAWNPENIPARTEKSFRAAEDRLNAAAGNDAKLAQLKRDYGVKGPPALGRVGSLSRPVSYPWDIMHLFFENIIPGLVKLWTGGKRFPVGDESYVLSPETVNEIWDETSAAFHHIPSSFVRSLAGAPEKFTAEATAFWFIYLMPALLKGRLPAEHYKHACLLVKIIKLCLQFTITDAELTNMRRYIIQWVREHERLYFQYYEQRLSVCTLPIHGLLHVPGNIRNCGPSWTTWTFFMERYCGFLKLAVKSKRIPWANLTKRILYFAYLEQIAVRWDLTQEMALFGRVDRNSVSAFEHRYEHYPDVILRAPYQKARLLSTQARSALAAYLAPVLQVKKRTIEGLLPAEVRRWGKFRLPDGDCFRAAAIFERGDETLRDNTYVRFYKQTRTTDDNDRAVWAPVLAYGRLEEILECPLPKKTVLAKYSGKIGLFAVITPCKTSGRDASEKLVSYREEEAMVVVDLDNVRATVGRVWSREKWTIIDRSQGLVKPDFVPLALMPEEDGGVEAT